MAASRDLGEQLWDASRDGHVDKVERLLARGAPVNWRSSYGWTALRIACVTNKADVVKILTQQDGIDVNVQDTWNNTPLHYACYRGGLKCVQLLMATGQCDLGAVGSGGLTPLGEAVRWGKLNTIKYLITECNVNINGDVTRDGLTPLGLAVREGHLDMIKFLIMKCNVAVNDGILTDSALLLACKRSDAEFIEYLLNVVGCDPNIKDDDGHTPLFLAGSKEIILLLLQHGATAENAYSQHRKALGKVFSKDPLKNPVKILVIGHGGEGKSTLIEAMEHEPTALTSLVNIFVSPKEVDGVSQKTAGIIPRLFKSRVFGDVLVYDFAGQEVYYSSHAAIIKNTVDACRPIIVLVLGLHKDDTYTTHSVSYWLGIIANQCANMEGKAPLIVVGSHADCLTDDQKISKKEEIVLEAVSRYPTLDLLKFIPMDNRYSNSSGMKILRATVGPACASIRSTLAVSLNAHMFLIYLVGKDEIALSLEQVQQQRNKDFSQVLSKKHKEVVPFIPTTIPRLVDICVQLNDKSHILFLHNASSPEKSFIVIKKEELLGKVNGTIFAPEDFDQHCQLSTSTSTGVVPCSKLAAQFPNLDTDMLTGFLINLEFAVPIEDPEVLRLINQHRTDAGKSVPPDEKYLFCPALIRLEVDTKVFKHCDDLAYHFGWVMSCSHKNQFLDARFLHVLLLRISLSLGLAPIIDSDIPFLQRQCSVWKTGVCWSTSYGVKVLVEVINKKKVVVLMQARQVSMKFLKLRSTVIKKVVDTSTEICSTVVTEQALLPPHSVTYPLEDTHVFDLKSLADSIIGQEICVVSANGVENMPISDLLQAEVYADLGENIVQHLFNPAHKELSDRFISALVTCWNKNPRLADIVRTAITENASAAFQECNNLDDVLIVWNNTGDSSGEALRRILDPLSVFAGRNPLELAGVAAKETSDDLLPTPRPTANTDGATLTTIDHEERTDVRQPSSPGTASDEGGVGLQELMDKYHVDTVQLDREIPDNEVAVIAAYFDSVELYSQAMGLSAADQTTVRTTLLQYDAQTAMTRCLSIWKQLYSFKATFRALLELLLRLNRTEVAAQVCQYLTQNS
ncbi:uncharacterized protein LOC135338452 isoform X2 [Halichondria panicea]|uniref:uncharacterized protein LOC135338452 isoform X2 n=1 Tax=Halichondria panicea TaxID=6063 RepID=UPI00312B36C2